MTQVFSWFISINDCFQCVWCMSSCMCIWGRVHMHMEARVNARCLPQSLFTFYLLICETGSLTETWSSLILIDWLAQWIPKDPSGCLPNDEVTDTLLHVAFLLECWRLNSDLHASRQALYWAISLPPSKIVFQALFFNFSTRYTNVRISINMPTLKNLKVQGHNEHIFK